MVQVQKGTVQVYCKQKSLWPDHTYCCYILWCSRWKQQRKSFFFISSNRSSLSFSSQFNSWLHTTLCCGGMQRSLLKSCYLSICHIYSPDNHQTDITTYLEGWICICWFGTLVHLWVSVFIEMADSGDRGGLLWVVMSSRSVSTATP